MGAIVILIAAMRHGATPQRVRELSELIAADRRTIDRWQTFWREHFPLTPFWKVARGRIALLAEDLTLPGSLMNMFLRLDSPETGWENLLRFLSPITVSGALSTEGLP
ncbi:MAG: hypothetical protein ACOX1P_07585 [Thermoguttaceae bacterium]